MYLSPFRIILAILALVPVLMAGRIANNVGGLRLSVSSITKMYKYQINNVGELYLARFAYQRACKVGHHKNLPGGSHKAQLPASAVEKDSLKLCLDGNYSWRFASRKGTPAAIKCISNTADSCDVVPEHFCHPGEIKPGEVCLYGDPTMPKSAVIGCMETTTDSAFTDFLSKRDFNADFGIWTTSFIGGPEIYHGLGKFTGVTDDKEAKMSFPAGRPKC